MKKFLAPLIFLIGFYTVSFGESGYVKITNEMIYQKLIEIEKRQAVFEEKFEQIDKRFEQINKRIDDLREDMNKRFELVDKRFEEINKRFEQIDKRFEDMFTFLWIITGIFTTLTLGVIGFAFWDRRTIIKKAKEETIEEIEKEGRLKDLIEALRELAKKDPELAKILKNYNLL
ncbi:MAG: hemagglutinin [Aquificae bacterium]|nr:hemagglutinin [Aquificota bacterium]